MDIQRYDFSVNLLRSVLWQYENAENLQALIRKKQAWYETNHSSFWQNWYKDVFCLDTANDFGLSVWGIILGENRDAFVGDPSSAYPAFGFEGRETFSHGNFLPSGAGFLKLATEPYRLLLQLRYFKLISRGTVPEINAFMARLFGKGNAHILDGYDMTLTYVFKIALQSWQKFIILDMDALPRPAGVQVKVVSTTEDYFGFEQYNNNFADGHFAPSAQ